MVARAVAEPGAAEARSAPQKAAARVGRRRKRAKRREARRRKEEDADEGPELSCRGLVLWGQSGQAARARGEAGLRCQCRPGAPACANLWRAGGRA
eukprot:1923592-Rhodomonas_salina.6